MQVVILYHIGVGLAHTRYKTADKLGFRRLTGPVGLQYLSEAVGIPNRDHEDSIRCWIESGRLKIELHSVDFIERQFSKICSTRTYEILFFWR